MMGASSPDALPDAAARRRTLVDHDSTLLVEAGAGSGKTALMAGRIALLLAGGVRAREIVAITFTEAASAELLERIDRFVGELASAHVPDELHLALPVGLSPEQATAIAAASETLDELTCTTIHGFCQKLVTPYPVEAEIDPGAAIIDPAAADLAYQDLVQAWLSARFGRDRGAEGLGRLPPLPELGEDDFFAELVLIEPDALVKLFQDAAAFLRTKRTARATEAAIDGGSLLDPRLDALPAFDALAPSVVPSTPREETENLQDEATWRAEAATIAAMRQTIVWRSPSRHEAVVGEQVVPSEEEIFTNAAALGESLPADAGPALPRGTIQGGRERGLVLHKLLEEVLTGETAESLGALEIRARSLLAELGAAESESPADGPHPAEIAATALRALAIPEVAALRARLLPEMTVFSAATAGDQITFVGGVVDALALAADGAVDIVIDWKSDVDPSAAQVELYRAQVRDYLAATDATDGLLVFATSGRIERLRRPDNGPSGQGLAPAKHVRETPPVPSERLMT